MRRPTNDEMQQAAQESALANAVQVYRQFAERYYSSGAVTVKIELDEDWDSDLGASYHVHAVKFYGADGLPLKPSIEAPGMVEAIERDGPFGNEGEILDFMDEQVHEDLIVPPIDFDEEGAGILGLQDRRYPTLERLRIQEE